jgi:5'-3' exonuclease
MRSQNYEARTDVEASEFARNLAGTVLYYISRFQPDEVVFALDSRKGYWRHEVMKDYYKKKCEAFTYIDPETEAEKIILKYDLKVYRIDWIEGPDKYVSKKLTKDEKAELDGFKLKKLPYKKVPEEIRYFYPAYKGNRRESSWDYTTTREEWHELCRKIVRNLAVTTKAKIFQVDKAEADDIAKVYADKNAAHDLVFVTTDSDWSQLLVDHMFLRLYNPTKRIWIDMEPKEAEYDLAKKLLCGDTSDNIPGVYLKGGKATLGPKAAEKLIQEQANKLYDSLEEIADHDGLYRNYELIFLENIPESIEDKISVCVDTAKIEKSKKPFLYSHFGVTKKDELAIKGEAQEDRKADEEGSDG